MPAHETVWYVPRVEGGWILVLFRGGAAVAHAATPHERGPGLDAAVAALRACAP